MKKLLLPLFILLISAIVFAQQEQMLSLRAFKGLNTKDASHNINDDQLTVAENVFIEDREIKVRGGYGRFNTSCLMGYDWTDESAETVSDIGYYSSIAIDSNDYPHISYYDSILKDLKYIKWNGFDWITTTVDSDGIVGLRTSIVLDCNDYPAISYYDLTNQNLKYAKWNGSNWITTTVDNNNSVGQYSSMALDKDKNPWISYWDFTENNLKCAKFDGVSWSTTTVDNNGDVGIYTSIALDDRNPSSTSVYIAYNDSTNEALKQATGLFIKDITVFENIVWSTSTIDNAGNTGNFISMTLDSNGYSHIAYQDATNTSLKYAVNYSGYWSTSTINNAADVGRYASIVLNSDNYPRISYSNSTDTSLEYIEYDGSSWSTTVIDNSADVGSHTSIDLNSKGYPCISYYDATGNDLKYATYAELPCEPIRFLDEYTQSDGDKFLMMVYGSTVCYSVHKDSFTVLLGTMSSTANYWGEAYNDNYYIGNQADGFYKFDGSAFTLVSGSIQSLYSLCSYDKIYLGNQAGEKSKVIYSNIGDAETFPGDQYLYINRNDGDEITGIGMLSYPIVFKSRSMWRLINTDDAYPENDGFICISPSIGATYGSTIQEKDGLLYFISERGVEVTDGVSVKKISGVIDKTMDEVAQREAIKGYWKQTTKEHFEQGTYDATTLDLETLSDSMYLKPQTTQEDFGQGTCSNTDVTTSPGNVILGVDTGDWKEYLGDISGTTGNITEWIISDFTHEKLAQSFYTTNVTKEAGIRVRMYLRKNPYLTMGWEKDYTIELSEWISGGWSTMCNWTQSTLGISETGETLSFDNEDVTLKENTYYQIKLYPNEHGPYASFEWGLLDGNYISGSAYGVDGQPILGRDYCCDFYLHPYNATGNFTSQYLNFGSTPTSSGYFIVEDTLTGSTSLSYQICNSSASVGGYGSWQTILRDVNIDTILTTPKQYLKWKAIFTRVGNFQTPTLSAIWQGSCFQSLEKNAGSDWTSWGLFESVGDFPSGTETSYQVRTSNVLGGTASASWQTVTNLYEIENSTGPYIQFRANFLKALETQSPRIDSLTVNWYDSVTGLRPVSAIVDNRIWWAVKKKENDYNQTIIVLDENGQWSEFTNFPAASFCWYKYNLYFGSSNSKGYIYKYDNNLTRDDVEHICPRIKTKAFDMKAPFNDKQSHRLWLYYAYNTTYSNSTVKYYFNDSVTEEKEIEIDLTADKGPIRARVGMPIGQRFRYISLEVSDFTTFYGFDLIHSILSEGER